MGKWKYLIAKTDRGYVNGYRIDESGEYYDVTSRSEDATLFDINITYDEYEQITSILKNNGYRKIKFILVWR